VYKDAFQLQQDIFDLSKAFPLEERYSLTDQMRRASRSVGANISEAWQRRRYRGHFVSTLTDSDAELAETEHWLKTAHACSYMSTNECSDLMGRARQIGRQLGSMMSAPEKWCGNSRTS